MSRLLHSFAAPAGDDFIEVERGSGALLYDLDGNEYVDGMANLWLCQIGHGRTEMVDAISEQLRRIAGYHTFDPFTNEPAERLANLLAELSPMDGTRTFLACSGSEAIDSAIKFARLYHRQRGEPHRQIIVRRTHGYHGTNIGGTSAQGIAANRDGWGDLLPHVVEVPHDNIEPAAEFFAEHGDHIAAVISEPVQGAGGVRIAPDGYLVGLRRLCDQHGALLVHDEVICGFGRTGEWFASTTFNVVPDLITFAKGVTSGYLPLSGVMLAGHVAAALDDLDMLHHGYTYSGHPASCVAALTNIDIIAREGLVERAVEVGAMITDGLSALQDDGLITGYRGIGALWGADVGASVAQYKRALVELGAVLRPIGSVIAFCPPLMISEPEVSRLVDAVETVARRAHRKSEAADS